MIEISHIWGKGKTLERYYFARNTCGRLTFF